MKINIALIVSAIAISVSACHSSQKTAAPMELYKAADLTPEKSFTTGVEGPAVDAKANLYAVNYEKEGTIGRITPAGKRDVFIELPNGSVGNGIRFNSKGEMMIADYTKHNVLKVDMDTKEVSVYAHDSTMNQPNDIAIDNNDRIYASDPNWKAGTGRIWIADTSGRLSILEDNMGTTNGIEVSPDASRLYVNESAQRKVWVYDLSAEGAISNKRLLIEFPDFGMDGMRCDADGNLYIARYGKGVVAKLSPAGQVLTEIKLTGAKPTNVCFGGADGKTVYVTLQDRGNIEFFRVDVAGREWGGRK